MCLTEIVLKSHFIKTNIESIGNKCFTYYIYMPFRVFTQEEDNLKNYLKFIYRFSCTGRFATLVDCVVLDLNMYIKFYFLLMLLIHCLLLFTNFHEIICSFTVKFQF